MGLKSTGGIILPKTKNPSKDDIILYDCPARVGLPLTAGSVPTVSQGEYVCRFQKIAENEDGFVTSASIPGRITECGDGFIVIENDMSQKTAESDPEKPGTIDDITYESLLGYCRRYGLSGAYSGEPLYKKISEAYGNCSRIIINCMESDPYSGHVRALVAANAKEIVFGAKILMFGMGVKKCVFALGASYGQAISAIKDSINGTDGMVIASIKEKYPVGNEYLLLNAIYGKELSRSKSTARMGYPVFSAETVFDLFESLRTGTPSVYKVLTLAGKGFAKTYAVRVPSGCSVADIADFIGTSEKFNASFALGGPLNPLAVDRDSFILPNTNMLLAYKEKNTSDGTCIRCARCASFCPMDLVPFIFHENYNADESERSVKAGLYNCIECGICSYICVGRVDLLAEIRAQKAKLNAPDEPQPEQSVPEDAALHGETQEAEEAEEKTIDHESTAEEILDAVADDILTSYNENAEGEVFQAIAENPEDDSDEDRTSRGPEPDPGSDTEAISDADTLSADDFAEGGEDAENVKTENEKDEESEAEKRNDIE